MTTRARRPRLTTLLLISVFIAVAAAAQLLAGGEAPPETPQPREVTPDGPLQGVAVMAEGFIEPGERHAGTRPMTDGRIVAIPLEAAAAVLGDEDANDAQERLQYEGIALHVERLGRVEAVQAPLDDQGRFSLDADPGSYLLCPLLDWGAAAGCGVAHFDRGRQLQLWWNAGDVWITDP